METPASNVKSIEEEQEEDIDHNEFLVKTIVSDPDEENHW